jgi:hypothetical protein
MSHQLNRYAIITAIGILFEELQLEHNEIPGVVNTLIFTTFGLA